MALANSETVEVRLRAINNIDSHPIRSFTLKAPEYTLKVGRGSRSGSIDLYPAGHNAWFESRVMSREHALFRADPVKKAGNQLPLPKTTLLTSTSVSMLL